MYQSLGKREGGDAVAMMVVSSLYISERGEERKVLADDSDSRTAPRIMHNFVTVPASFLIYRHHPCGRRNITFFFRSNLINIISVS